MDLNDPRGALVLSYQSWKFGMDEGARTGVKMKAAKKEEAVMEPGLK